MGPLGVLFGNCRDARHGAVAPFPTQPPQEPPLQQLGVEPVGLGPAMFARYGDTRRMDYMRLKPMRTKPARQPEAVPTSFEGQCNPRDLAAGLDRLVAPAMQQGKQPFWVRLQLLAGLALNAGKHTGNQPTRLAHLDDGNDRAILVQGDEGPAQVVRLGHRGTPCWIQRRWCHFLAARPIASLSPTYEPTPAGRYKPGLPASIACLAGTSRMCQSGRFLRTRKRDLFCCSTDDLGGSGIESPSNNAADETQPKAVARGNRMTQAILRSACPISLRVRPAQRQSWPPPASSLPQPPRCRPRGVHNPRCRRGHTPSG